MENNLIVVEYKEHDKLVDFYISRGIEFGDDKKYFHPPVFSYVALINDELVGAITVCKEDDDFILDEVAVKEEYTNKGICKSLVDTVIKRIEKENGNCNMYLVAKHPEVFTSMGFKEIPREDSPSFSECFTCPDFQKNCFPKVMVKNIIVLEDKKIK